ncbi:hypothetical protein EKN56_10525 [Limnobaculum zhutongyuii]|uniref:Uncharacterized protein n=1 Tax=Limnobaculum zhutongyuii TaxID=2498113 RepID=A0A411WKQ7_9GAMM|nr:hypothetical protein [Limnobaculum zhutongyuii]QBH96803.1 hypothetical protein EKN56_10525 [Limnobaculum zhutongyuii]TQS90166.1 hypothetical protein ELQ32_02065 [Limnobaculum zhutongyuii]
MSNKKFPAHYQPYRYYWAKETQDSEWEIVKVDYQGWFTFCGGMTQFGVNYFHEIGPEAIPPEAYHERR